MNIKCKYILNLIIAIAFIYLIDKLLKISEILKSESNISMSIVKASLGVILYIITYVLIGLFLGSYHKINQFQNKGKWKINYNKLLCLSVPLIIIILVYYLFVYFNHYNIFLKYFSQFMIDLCSILLGFTLIDIIEKK